MKLEFYIKNGDKAKILSLVKCIESCNTRYFKEGHYYPIVERAGYLHLLDEDMDAKYYYCCSPDIESLNKKISLSEWFKFEAIENITADGFNVTINSSVVELI